MLFVLKIFLIILMSQNITSLYANSNKSIKLLRATYWSDPSESIALGWTQTPLGAEIHYRERSTHHAYHILRVNTPTIGQPHWIQLGGLKSNTSYEFKIVHALGESHTYWFKTLSKVPSSVHIVVGGDSRNHRRVRRNANRFVAYLSPDFVMFGGDFTTQSTQNQWRQWLEDWQLTIDHTRKLIPILPARGNHDRSESMQMIWGRAFPNFYYAFDIGGDLLRVYTLNSEIPAGGKQKQWLQEDLHKNKQQKLKFIQYHKPMRPHYKYKSEGQDEYEHWAPLFTKYHVDLAIECDSHLMKTTWPLIYDPQGEEGFRQVKTGGTIFIGEGGWGAPLRQINDRKSWTRTAERSNHIFSIKVKANASYSIQALPIPISQSQVIQTSTSPHTQTSLNFDKILQFSPMIKVQ